LVADNKIAELAETDNKALQAILKGIDEDDFGLTGMEIEDVELVLDKVFVEGDTEGRGAGNDVTDEIESEQEAYIVPVALTRAQYREWEKKKEELGCKSCKKAFLKMAGL